MYVEYGTREWETGRFVPLNGPGKEGALELMRRGVAVWTRKVVDERLMADEDMYDLEEELAG